MRTFRSSRAHLSGPARRRYAWPNPSAVAQYRIRLNRALGGRADPSAGYGQHRFDASLQSRTEHRSEVWSMVGREFVQFPRLLSIRVDGWIDASNHPEDSRHIPSCGKQPEILARRIVPTVTTAESVIATSRDTTVCKRSYPCSRNHLATMPAKVLVLDSRTSAARKTRSIRGKAGAPCGIRTHGPRIRNLRSKVRCSLFRCGRIKRTEPCDGVLNWPHFEGKTRKTRSFAFYSPR